MHADAVDEVVELDGALVTPTFVDAHVHLSQTGQGLAGVDLLDARVPRRGARAGSRPAPGGDRAARCTCTPGTRPAGPRGARSPRPSWTVRRTAGWSTCPASTATPRWSPRRWPPPPARATCPAGATTGWSTRESHHAARTAFHAASAPATGAATSTPRCRRRRRRASAWCTRTPARTSARRTTSRDVIAAGERGDGPQVVGLLGELARASSRPATLLQPLAGPRARRRPQHRRLVRLAHGRAARRRTPTPGHHGNAYLSVEQVRDHVVACTLAGAQAGFHVIGDAGADTVVAGMRGGGRRGRGWTGPRARHRLEHLEMVDPDGIATLVGLGVVASVQPAFDALLGRGRRHVRRAARRRARGTRSTRSPRWLAAGVSMALGSDSPVTPVAPWEAVRACVNHRNPGSGSRPARRSSPTRAAGGGRPASTTAGYLDLGQPASFAIWSVGRPGRPGPRRPDPDLEHRPPVGHAGPARPVAGRRPADHAADRRPRSHRLRAGRRLRLTRRRWSRGHGRGGARHGDDPRRASD